LRAALASDPGLPRAHERLGMIALAAGDAASAVLELEAERAASGDDPPPGLAFELGRAYARLGDRDHARAAYRAELRRAPGHLEALDSLRVLEPEGGR
ncbi:MAG: tetratricopeptide repeat protein, partial [Candidatus Eisenbacteria bacterium]|nr:tetratricopeptide repeat protein [Candidatus Eisenbacteria bacterium]